MNIKLITEEFIKKSIKKYGNIFDYSKSIYVNSQIKIEIICPKHDSFWQTPNTHLNSKTIFGCPKCSYEHLIKLNTNSFDSFVERSNILHNNLFIYDKSTYKNSKIKTKIFCSKLDKNDIEHGSFWQTPNKHLCGQKCPKCSVEIVSQIENDKFKTTYFDRVNAIYGNQFTYLSSYIKADEKIKMQCMYCNRIVEHRAVNHLNGCGCSCKGSKGERNIEKFLNKYNIEFIKEAKFSGCIGKKNKLPFDFYLPKHNICIEFDGPHHFKPHKYNYNENDFDVIQRFENIKITDAVRNKYCIENGIKLIRITLSDEENLYNILSSELNLSNSNNNLFHLKVA